MTNIEGKKKCPGAGMMCVTSESASYHCPVCNAFCFAGFDGRDLPTVPNHDDERQTAVWRERD